MPRKSRKSMNQEVNAPQGLGSMPKKKSRSGANMGTRFGKGRKKSAKTPAGLTTTTVFQGGDKYKDY